MQGHPPAEFQGRTILFQPFPELKFILNREKDRARLVWKVFTGRPADSTLGALVSERLFAALQAKIAHAQLKVIADPTQADLHRVGIVDSLPGYRPDGDTASDAFHYLDSTWLLGQGLQPDMVLVFTNPELEAGHFGYRQGNPAYCVERGLVFKSTFMIWDYRIAKAVVNGRIHSEWKSCSFSRAALDDLIEDVVSLVLYHTPFDYR